MGTELDKDKDAQVPPDSSQVKPAYVQPLSGPVNILDPPGVRVPQKLTVEGDAAGLTKRAAVSAITTGSHTQAKEDERLGKQGLNVPAGGRMKDGTRLRPIWRLAAHPDAEEVAEAGACLLLLNSELSNGAIRFKSASAELQPGSTSVLSRLANTVRRCPGVQIEISGYADSDGAEKFNLELSTDRAQRVAMFLIEAGISRKRIRAIGYGESHPIVANDTPKNKAKNRRIEFRVKG